MFVRLRAALLAHDCAALLGLLPATATASASGPASLPGAPQRPAAEVVSLLLEATASPVLNEHASYERLEVLGDSFLKLAVVSSLFLRHPDYHEASRALRCSCLRVVVRRCAFVCICSTRPPASHHVKSERAARSVPAPAYVCRASSAP